MNAFALAWSGMFGGLGASGLYRPAARACVSAIIDAKASEPMPQKQSVKNSRRFRLNRICSAISVHVKKRIQVENRQGEFLHLGGVVGMLRQELHGERPLTRGRPTTSRQPPRIVDPLRRRLAILEQPPGEDRRQLVRCLPVQQLE